MLVDARPDIHKFELMFTHAHADFHRLVLRSLVFVQYCVGPVGCANRLYATSPRVDLWICVKEARRPLGVELCEPLLLGLTCVIRRSIYIS